jgi:hypothetical protein
MPVKPAWLVSSQSQSPPCVKHACLFSRASGYFHGKSKQDKQGFLKKQKNTLIQIVRCKRAFKKRRRKVTFS